MSSILWAVLWAVLFFAFAGDGQAGDLPWGSQYYRVRPEGLKGSAVPDVPSQGQGAAVRPWGEVPLEWREGGADRRVPSRGVGEDRRLVPGWGYGGRWDERVSPGWLSPRGDGPGAFGGADGFGWGYGDPWRGEWEMEAQPFYPGPFGW